MVQRAVASKPFCKLRNTRVTEIVFVESELHNTAVAVAIR